ncbi:endoplasmic reticulum protein [Mycena maculata]|uniref:Endoplasmic reticulum protein n=1 Tax=Mycena maculata TaxID=230809 RepID=A0AAD7KFB3_9AGAR|nr:endoplasmic reticulum protein [Mycena maculata]
MFRIAAVRVGTQVLPRVSRLAFLPRTAQRYESSTSGPPRSDKDAAAFKAARELSDELQRDWDAKVISYEDLLAKTHSPSPDSYLIDVREPDEVIQGMIPSAVNLPLSVLANSLHLNSEAFKAKHGFEKPKKWQEVIFYCRSGMRSTSASDVAKRNGYTNILNYKGSWLEWSEKKNVEGK